MIGEKADKLAKCFSPGVIELEEGDDGMQCLGCVCVCVCTCMNVNLYVNLYVYVCLCVCVV